jgi:hypothetical protein
MSSRRVGTRVHAYECTSYADRIRAAVREPGMLHTAGRTPAAAGTFAAALEAAASAAAAEPSSAAGALQALQRGRSALRGHSPSVPHRTTGEWRCRRRAAPNPSAAALGTARSQPLNITRGRRGRTMEPWLKPCSCASSLSFRSKAACLSFSFSLDRRIFMLRMCVCTMSKDSGPPYMSSLAREPLTPADTSTAATPTSASADPAMMATRSGRVLPPAASDTADSMSCPPFVARRPTCPLRPSACAHSEKPANASFARATGARGVSPRSHACRRPPAQALSNTHAPTLSRAPSRPPCSTSHLRVPCHVP